MVLLEDILVFFMTAASFTMYSVLDPLYNNSMQFLSKADKIVA